MKRKLLILFILLLTLGAATDFTTNTSFAQEDGGFEWDTGGGPPPSDCQLTIATRAGTCITAYNNAHWGWTHAGTSCAERCNSAQVQNEQSLQCITSCAASGDPLCYGTCMTQANTTCNSSCIGALNQQFINATNEFGPCLSAASQCTYQPDFCTAARQAAATCAAQYAGNPETIGQFIACRNASGIDQCQ